MKVLADISMQISATRNTLSKLEETETEYLVLREKKALDRISKLLEDSRELLNETHSNHEEIKQFSNTVLSSANYVSEVQEKFHHLWDAFEKRNSAWEKEIKIQEKEAQKIKDEFKAERIAIENSKVSLKKSHELLATEKRKIEDQRGVLVRMIQRLGKNRI